MPHPLAVDAGAECVSWYGLINCLFYVRPYLKR